MFGKAKTIRTGSIVGEFDGPDGGEIAAAIRLPRTTWERLGAGLYEIIYGNEHGEFEPDEEVPIEDRIRVTLELLEAEWEGRLGPQWRDIDDDLDDGVPF